jgi:hypothetical protein
MAMEVYVVVSTYDKYSGRSISTLRGSILSPSSE